MLMSDMLAAFFTFIIVCYAVALALIGASLYITWRVNRRGK